MAAWALLRAADVAFEGGRADLLRPEQRGLGVGAWLVVAGLSLVPAVLPGCWEARAAAAGSVALVTSWWSVLALEQLGWAAAGSVASLVLIVVLVASWGSTPVAVVRHQQRAGQV